MKALNGWTRVVAATVGVCFLQFGADARAAVFNLVGGTIASPNIQLNQTIENASPGDTINLGAGYYVPAATSGAPQAVFSTAFMVKKRVNIIGAGASTTFLNALATTLTPEYGVQFRTLGADIDPQGATLQNVTVNTRRGGAIVLDLGNLRGGQPIRNIVIRNVVFNTSQDPAFTGDSGIYLGAQENAVIDGVTVIQAAAAGVYIDGGKGHVIMNSTFLAVRYQHPIILNNTTNNLVLNNTISLGNPSGRVDLEGIVLKTASHNRVEGNTLTGYNSDGIVLTDYSNNNVVVHNTMETNSYRYGQPLVRAAGVGLWLNCDSNRNYVAGNRMRGSPEVGFAVYSARHNFIVGNTVWENEDGGIFLTKNASLCGPGFVGNTPVYNTLHRNASFYNEVGGGYIGRQTQNTELAFNYISARNEANQLLTYPNGTVGIGLDQGTTDDLIFGNTVTETVYGILSYAPGSTNAQVFRNRFVGTQANIIQNVAPNTQPVKFHDEIQLGGNYWNGGPAQRNPDPLNAYFGVLSINPVGTPISPSPLVDRYPFANETLGLPYGSVVKAPLAGAVVAAGRRTRIEWHSESCGFVNLSYRKGVAASTLIYAKAPNTGYFMWTPPAVTPGADYNVGVECVTLAGVATGVVQYGASFSMGSGDLQLLFPHHAHQAVAGSTMRIVWRKAANLGTVDIYYNIGGANVLLLGAVSGTFADVTVPSLVTNKARITVVSGAAQDGTDGSFSIRNATSGSITSLTAGQKVLIAGLHELQWVSHRDSELVDITFTDHETGAVQKFVINLPDRCFYSWLVREYSINDVQITLTQKNAAGTIVGTVNSPVIDIVYRLDTGTPVNRYRLYNYVTLEHLFTTDLNEYNTLGANTGRWFTDGIAMKTYTAPATVGGFKLRPYYRLYNTTTLLHYWTIDRADYFTKRAQTSTWFAEGIDGYMLFNQAAGSLPMYRMFFPPFDKYLWTIDANEYNTLVGSGSYLPAGRVGLPTGVDAYAFK